jgi:hypothetical protein
MGTILIRIPSAYGLRFLVMVPELNPTFPRRNPKPC